MSWWIWILVGFALLVLEMTTATLHVGFFAVGAFVVAALVGFGVDLPLWGEILLFTVVSLFAFLVLRPLLMKRFKLDVRSDVDSLIGEQAIAMEELPAGGTGKAELRGSTWNARNIGETVLMRGQHCTVAAIEGLVIHVHAS